MKKRALRWVFALALLLPCLLLSAAATEERTVTASGSCGSEVTWTLYEDGELVIAGSGSMKNYMPINSFDGHHFDTPWIGYSNKITAVTIKSGVTHIGTNAFNNMYEDFNALTCVTFEDNMADISIGNYAFCKCVNLTELELLRGLASIGSFAFKGCTGITLLTLPDIESISENAFQNCTGLVSVALGNGLRYIGTSVFEGCTNLEYVNIPDNVTEIRDGAFSGCEKLTNITLPDSLIEIGHGAFRDCKNLTTMVVPDTVINIGQYAFSGCTLLAKMEFLGDAPTVGNSAFLVSENVKFYYHEGTTGWPTTGTWQGRPLVMIYDVENYKPAGKHPEKEDHIFAGWYGDEDHKNPHKEQSGPAHAKFVHKDVFRVKGQISTNTTPQSEFADIRFLTSVDCLNYKRIGFKITFGGKTVTQEFSTVYSSIVSNTEGLAVEVTPDQAFHADSQYFVTMVLKEIPNKHFDDVFTVTPYWVTQDGTVVEGVTNELRVSDGF